jgi:hypothetical protein
VTIRISQAGFGIGKIILLILVFAVVGTVGLGVSKAEQSKKQKVAQTNLQVKESIEKLKAAEAVTVPEAVGVNALADLPKAQAVLSAVDPAENGQDLETMDGFLEGF